MFRKACIACKSTDLREIISLGMHPMADTFIPADRLSEPDRVYPLICDLCSQCGQIQLRTITNPSERYSEIDYSYTSSNSKTSRSHWEEYAATVSGRIGLKADDTVLEIGSNDGYLTEQFQKLGCKSLGVDPSPAMAKLAEQRGVQTLIGLFGQDCVGQVEKTLGKKPRLIAANNVFNHADEPHEFALGVKAALAPDGVFVFELPYWMQMIVQRKFDQIYHEHVNYFTVKYAVNLFKVIGMHVNHADEVDYHGGSIRVFVGHQPAPDETVAKFTGAEEKAGLFNPATYAVFMQEIQAARNRFLQEIYRLKGEGQPVVCVGAAAKGNTFLSYYNLDATVIDCVTESAPREIGKYTPRTRIPIYADQKLAEYESVYAIILSWNISAPLQNILKKINPRIQFLNPYAS